MFNTEQRPLDALLKVKLFLSATRVPLPGTPRLQGTNATTSAGTAVLDCPGGSTGTSRPLRFAARQGRSASGRVPPMDYLDNPERCRPGRLSKPRWQKIGLLGSSCG